MYIEQDQQRQSQGAHGAQPHLDTASSTTHTLPDILHLRPIGMIGTCQYSKQQAEAEKITSNGHNSDRYT
jgi:hypothetical protein